MEYIGLQTQIRKNNFISGILLLLFPLLILGLTWLFFFLSARFTDLFLLEEVNTLFIEYTPWVCAGVAVWFFIAWFSHTGMIQSATASKPLERKGNERVYNLVENLCISRGMKVPNIYIIQDDSLNAFAFGINKKTFSISLSKGIISKLNDQELEAVIAHELSHIRNRDVRLLILSIIFVGIFAFITHASFRMAGRIRGRKKGGAIILIFLVIGLIGLLCATLMRFGLSRKREFLADAGAAELTKNPLALASALKKIAADPAIEAVVRKDVAQLFIENPAQKDGEKGMGLSSFLNGMFATHPPIRERIQVLEQF